MSELPFCRRAAVPSVAPAATASAPPLLQGLLLSLQAVEGTPSPGLLNLQIC